MATILPRPGRKGQTHYRAEVRRKGFPTQVKTFARRGDAEKWARMLERAMDEGTWKDPKAVDTVTLAEALTQYLATVSVKKRPRTRERDALSAHHLRESLGSKALDKITGPVLAGYRDARLKEVSPHSVRLELALLSHLYNTARRDWGLAIENPVRLIKKPTIPEGRCPALSQEQIARFLEECKKSRTALLYPFVLLALHTGCRSYELRSLKWSQVDLAQGTIHLIGPDVKTHRRRSIPLTSLALNIIKELAGSTKALILNGAPAGLVFPSRGLSDKPRDMHMAFDRAVKRAGLDNLPGAGKLRIHDLRHCCGSALIMSGADLETTRKILGHRDVTTTQRYLHVVDEHLRKTIDKIGHLGVDSE